MTRAGRHFEVITTPAPVTPARRAGWGRVTVTGVVALGLGLAAALFVQRALGSDAETRDHQTLDQATRLFDRLVAERRTSVVSQAAVLAGDTRVRAPVMTPTFDETTVRDVLQDLQGSAGASMLAILDPAGKVRAVAGAGGLRGLDFGSSPLVHNAAAHPDADVWILPDRALVIGIAPVRTADQTIALVAIGVEIGASLLAAVGDVTGVAGGLVVGDRLVASNAGDEPTRASLIAVGREEGERRTADGVLVRVGAAGHSAAGKLAWLVRSRGADWSAPARLVPWLFVPLVALGFILGALARRGATSFHPASERQRG